MQLASARQMSSHKVVPSADDGYGWDCPTLQLASQNSGFRQIGPGWDTMTSQRNRGSARGSQAYVVHLYAHLSTNQSGWVARSYAFLPTSAKMISGPSRFILLPLMDYTARSPIAGAHAMNFLLYAIE
ncbi:hypothetical protein 3 [Beihai tombus-like virus 7]|uniref:hypothetical protein 3 n=1 Tax=Beihai tombus-like virus 7 TaxID=1922728 RepID=UPI00090B6E94|nr:hypothetical protein 3 [Beihai tombus-like virus 7]APG76111.1 hypothetical protein 3 [Beihai tombus-like virus 7]